MLVSAVLVGLVIVRAHSRLETELAEESS